jgi:hypothetical protein
MGPVQAQRNAYSARFVEVEEIQGFVVFDNALVSGCLCLWTTQHLNADCVALTVDGKFLLSLAEKSSAIPGAK